MRKIITTAILAAFMLLLTATPSTAETIFNYQVDYFELSGNGLGTVSDDFDDGVLSPWHILQIEGVSGTAVEADGVVSLTNPGVEQPLPGYPSIIMERSDIVAPTSSYGVYDGLGDFVAESIWVPIVPDAPGGYYVMAFDAQIAEGTRELTAVAVANLSTVVAKNLIGSGAQGGLQIIQLRWDYEYVGGVFGDGTILEADQYLFDPEDMTGNIVLNLDFDDTTNEVLASFSLDGGTVYITPFAAMTSSLTDSHPGNWFLGGDPMTVPEPSSALMLASGLIALAVLGRKKVRK